MRRLMVMTAMLSMLGTAAYADATKTSADAALKAADARAALADKAGAQWTSTVALLKDAHKAEAAGDFATAQSKAMKADAMAKLSITEAHEQASLWQASVIH
ncbi:MAG: hypothetical protein B7Z75_01825 [Acidocella sp. 20-57-95]|nr:MAG: hypothetical protein B7Z75_01825 [Acidocella sp. 20-57-95]OYV62223.1 MAG: hypothetical protein B7Z71_02165 [Acidocella sp. 21-58-7]HQT63739.1 hypothetical protein [Acidocella sp.]HQU03114.1 hypothetical protein [Acidocella sp.]